MSRKEWPTWRDRYPGEITCVRCLEVKDPMELDRMLWCDACRARARERASWWGWLGGVAFGAAVAAYIWGFIRPTDLVIGGWVGTVVAATWIGSKISREIIYGAMRFRNAHAAEAVPPGTEPPGAGPRA